MAEWTITNNNFSQVLAADKPVLLDFWASWCGPCRMMSPVLEELARENADRIWVGKVNVDEEPFLAAQFGISSVPTLVLMKNGRAVQSSMGFMPKRQLQDWLDAAL